MARERTMVAVLALVATYGFFFEYLRPMKRVEIPYDLSGYHYPLANYAFQALRHGRIPQWDPTIYCGMGFASNPQAALFYPPQWALFAANRGRQMLTLRSLEEFVLLHVWLAFVLCYAWLRRRLGTLASLLGAGVFAYSGYAMNELQHLGGVAAYAWFPLGLMGVDECAERRAWRPLWKTAVASAMCFLAGYPPTWVAFAVSVMAYSLCRSRGWLVATKAAGALAFSLLLAMVQLAPTLEMNALKMKEVRWGGGYHDPAYYLSFLLPNYWNFSMKAPPRTSEGYEYLYLGAAGLAGLVLLLLHRRGEWRVAPLLGVLAAGLLVVANPFGIVSRLVGIVFVLSEVVRDHYFLAAVSIAAAALAAVGIDRFLKGPRRTLPPWFAWAMTILMTAWMARQLAMWRPRGAGLAMGWASALETAVTLAVFAAGLWVLRAVDGRARAVLMTALVIFCGVDYKVNGTSKRFNATTTAWRFAEPRMPEVDGITYLAMLSRPEQRVVVDQTGPFPHFLRQYGLTTPQGFDPFITGQYKQALDGLANFRTNWEFDVDSRNEDALRVLGVRYFITSLQGPQFDRLSQDPRFLRLEPSLYYKVFEYRESKPPYALDHGGEVNRTRWEPESRGFRVTAAAGGDLFHLTEQWAPGWRVHVDGALAPVERWRGAFMAVNVPAGEHVVEFNYHSNWLVAGAVISAVAWMSLILLVCIVPRRMQQSAQSGV